MVCTRLDQAKTLYSVPSFKKLEGSHIDFGQVDINFLKSYYYLRIVQLNHIV